MTADQATYDAEKLFGIDLNDDGAQGKNVQVFDTDAYINSKGITTFPGGSNNKTLITDINSGEILFASSLPGDSDSQTLLKNQDGTRFIAGDSFTAFDIEEASDGTIQLLSYVEEDGYITQTITETIQQRVKVGRKYRFVEQEVTTDIEVPVNAGQFVITTFDASGQLIQPTTLLNTADKATYDAEKLFGIDLNKDDVRGRNVTQIDELSEIRSYGFTTFDDTTNITDLYLDIHSGGLFFASSDDTNYLELFDYDGYNFGISVLTVVIFLLQLNK